MYKSDKTFFIGRPNIGNRDDFYRRLDSIFERRWLTNEGECVLELEKELSRYLGVKHCVAMCNGTVALELAIRANGMSGNVLVPSMTFIATAHALKWQEITPVFVDIKPSSLNICPDSVQRLIDENTTGIVGVHLYGRPCDIDTLSDIAERNNLKLIFDAAHAFGASYKGEKIGRYGNCEVFSFHATKVFNTFEGGAVTTNDDELAKKLRLMKNFGFEGEDTVSHIGINGKMAEVNAAMGLTNLEQLEDFIEINRVNYHAYRGGLRNVPGISLIHYDEDEANNYQYIIICIDQAQSGYSRDDLKEYLAAHGIIARRYFYPGCHKMEPYNSLDPHAGIRLPATEAYSKMMLALPTGTQICSQEIESLCDLIKSFKSRQ